MRNSEWRSDRKHLDLLLDWLGTVTNFSTQQLAKASFIFLHRLFFPAAPDCLGAMTHYETT